MFATLLGFVGIGGFTASAEATTSTLPLRSQYANSIGQTFTAARGRRRYQVKLLHIRDVAGATSAMREHSFNLIFTTPPGLPDGVYWVARTGVPAHSLFLSRIGTHTSTAATMQVLVNRSVI